MSELTDLNGYREQQASMPETPRANESHRHTVNHDEQQADQSDLCVICGVARHSHGAANESDELRRLKLEHVAWLRYKAGTGNAVTLQLCDSDDEDGFKVCRLSHAMNIIDRLKEDISEVNGECLALDEENHWALWAARRNHESVTALESERDALRAERDEASEYLGRLLLFVWPNIHLLDDILGRCTQVDNGMAVGMKKLRLENERLREALEKCSVRFASAMHGGSIGSAGNAYHEAKSALNSDGD